MSAVAVPFARSLWVARSEKQAFKVFLKAHAINAEGNFGDECSIEFARNNLKLNGQWMDILENNDLGVPKILVIIQEAIHKALSQSSHDEKYWPYITYLGTNNENAPLEHSSIIWKLTQSETKAAANYFITQEQVLTALKTQYEPPYFALIKDGSLAQRQQWCQRLESVLFDLAEHYVNLIALRKVLS